MDNFRQNRGVIHNSEKVININHINSVFPSKNAYVKICIKFRIFRLAYGRYFRSVLIDRNGALFDDFLSMAALSFPEERATANPKIKRGSIGCSAWAVFFCRNRFEYVLMYSGTVKQPLKMYFLMPRMA